MGFKLTLIVIESNGANFDSTDSLCATFEYISFKIIIIHMTV